MKTFCHVPIELEDLKTQTIDKKRFYKTPEGELYPSITTVLSVRNKKGYLNGVNELVMMLQTMLQG